MASWTRDSDEIISNTPSQQMFLFLMVSFMAYSTLWESLVLYCLLVQNKTYLSPHYGVTYVSPHDNVVMDTYVPEWCADAEPVLAKHDYDYRLPGVKMCH